MKTRSAIKHAGLLVALIFLFAALPSQTQGPSDLSIDNLRFSVENGLWKLNWESEGIPADIQVQFSSSAITDVWTTVDATLSVLPAAAPRTFAATFNPLIDNPAGMTVNFRVRVLACYLIADIVQCVWTSGGDGAWAYTSTAFDINDPAGSA